MMGATTLMATRKIGGRALVDTTEGDDLVLTQLVEKTSGAATYQAVGKSLAITSATFLDKMTTPLAGALIDVAQTKTLTTTWKHDAFTSHVAEINPAAMLVDQGIAVDVIPNTGTAFFDVGPGYPDVRLYGAPAATGDGAISFTYGDPFDATWTRFIGAGTVATVSLMMPGAAMPFTVNNSIQARVALGGATIEPLVTPAKSPKVNGGDGFVNATGVGVTPTISWSAPSVGTAGSYNVLLVTLANMGGTTSPVNLVRFHTTSTSLRIPPGFLNKGDTFGVSIETYSGAYVEATPGLVSMPFGFVSTTLGVFAP